MKTISFYRFYFNKHFINLDLALYQDRIDRSKNNSTIEFENFSSEPVLDLQKMSDFLVEFGEILDEQFDLITKHAQKLLSDSEFISHIKQQFMSTSILFDFFQFKDKGESANDLTN